MVIKIIRKKEIGNKIGDSGAMMIGEGLRSNSTLTELVLSSDEKEGIMKNNRRKGK